MSSNKLDMVKCEKFTNNVPKNHTEKISKFSRNTIAISPNITWICILKKWIICSRLCTSYWTKMYPMAGMVLSLLSAPFRAMFPQDCLSSGYPEVPNPILESLELQSSSLLLVIPILAFEKSSWSALALNPSLLQLSCKEAPVPSRSFHASRPSEVARYSPLAISEWREVPCWSMTWNLTGSFPTFIPTQILEKDVFQ